MLNEQEKESLIYRRKNMFCEKCGTQLAEGTRFCTKCGNPIMQNTPTWETKETFETQQSFEQPKKKLLIGI